MLVFGFTAIKALGASVRLASSMAAAARRQCMAGAGWRVVVVDESHALRTVDRAAGAPTTEAAVAAVAAARRAVLLSGTPSLSRPFDLFRQARRSARRAAAPLPGDAGSGARSAARACGQERNSAFCSPCFDLSRVLISGDQTALPCAPRLATTHPHSQFIGNNTRPRLARPAAELQRLPATPRPPEKLLSLGLLALHAVPGQPGYN